MPWSSRSSVTAVKSSAPRSTVSIAAGPSDTGPDGNRAYTPATFDHLVDSPLNAPAQLADPDAILLFDGIFLLRPELDGLWDVRIFVQVDFDVALRRAESRDLHHFRSLDALRERYARRYVPAQRSYLERVRPAERADVVIENVDGLLKAVW